MSTTKGDNDGGNPLHPTGHSAEAAGFKLSRAKQRDTFRVMLLEREADIASILRETCNLTEAAWPAHRLNDEIRNGIDRALRYPLNTFEEIVQFLVLRQTTSNRFDELPMVRDFLQRTDLPEGNRIQLMVYLLPLSVWGVIERRLPSTDRDKD